MRCIPALVLALLALPSVAAMRSVPTEWKVGDAAFSGTLVYDDAGAARPGLLLVPNWFGANAAAVEKAKTIASDKYVVLVADVYGKDIRPANPDEAGAAAKQAYADRALLRSRASAALDVLKRNAAGAPLDATRIAAIGFCFGGATVLELARAGTQVAAVVSFHGNLATTLPAAKDAVKASVLALNGADDSYVPAEQIAGFQKEMTDANIDWQFVNFSGAVHCFAEPDANLGPGCQHHERSAKRAYRMMDDFLAERFAAH